MVAIANGLTAFADDMIVPVTSTFSVFYLVSFNVCLDFMTGHRNWNHMSGQVLTLTPPSMHYQQFGWQPCRTSTLFICNA
jgi:hypothetical protein